jgi:hypothetical protein
LLYSVIAAGETCFISMSIFWLQQLQCHVFWYQWTPQTYILTTARCQWYENITSNSS